MDKYRVVLSRSATKELENLPHVVADRVVARLEALESSPRPAGALKLKGANLWRLRVGDYRVVYALDDAAKVVDVVIIQHRKDVYRDL
ncbi:MAG: type II toxin-antitoxin system RelE/ParE family toxin [Verrucomicrobiota bacterium]